MEFFATINNIYVFAGSVFLGALGGLLGNFAILRKQSLLGDTLAHAALPGIAIAFLIFKVKLLSVLLIGALIAGLLGAGFMYFLVRFSKIKMDTAMATVLSVFFGLGILFLTLIQNQPLAAQAGLDSFLFGQAAALLKQDVILIAVIFFLILFFVIVFWKELKISTFDPGYSSVIGFKLRVIDTLFMTVFVVAILVSLQAVGVVLTTAIFITPAAAALIFSQKLLSVVVISTLLGAFSGGIGVLISANTLDMPTGPVIVIIESIVFFITFIFAKKRGLLSKWLSHRSYELKVKRENVLGKLFRAEEKGETLALWHFENVEPKIWRQLKSQKLIKLVDSKVILTAKGTEVAAKILEKHRLWETYLVNKWSLPQDHVHRDAEEIEHVLTDEIAKKLKTRLEDPKYDPHGKPINYKK